MLIVLIALYPSSSFQRLFLSEEYFTLIFSNKKENMCVKYNCNTQSKFNFYQHKYVFQINGSHVNININIKSLHYFMHCGVLLLVLSSCALHRKKRLI